MLRLSEPPLQRKQRRRRRPLDLGLHQTLPNADKYALGDLISHPMFGGGTVVSIDADKLTIEFEGNVVKQIVDHYVKQQKL